MTLSYMMIIVEPGKENKVIKNLKKNKKVKETHMVYGEFDIIAKVKTKDLKALDKMVNDIRKLKSVKATSTMITTE